ncbi:hypothetical protein [Cupriavidus basilensis]|uniref:hypothetical protein n=1 Tax=Cupriavidus basilensis TaxID=68895 RepID=UPI003D33F004
MAGVRRGPLLGKLIVLLSVYAYERTVRYPASDDASLDADLARAMLGTRRRTIGTERGTASVASEQIARAKQNYALTARTVERLRPLAADGYVPKALSRYRHGRVRSCNEKDKIALSWPPIPGGGHQLCRALVFPVSVEPA